MTTRPFLILTIALVALTATIGLWAVTSSGGDAAGAPAATTQTTPERPQRESPAPRAPAPRSTPAKPAPAPRSRPARRRTGGLAACMRAAREAEDLMRGFAAESRGIAGADSAAYAARAQQIIGRARRGGCRYADQAEALLGQFLGTG